MKSILFYDGDCALCNKTVQFILKHEKQVSEPLLFSSLQSEYAKNTLAKFKYNFNELSTLVFLQEDKIFYKSTAALAITTFLKAPYNSLVALKIFPAFLRDWVYTIIARNRKKIIKQDFCVMPSISNKHRFID